MKRSFKKCVTLIIMINTALNLRVFKKNPEIIPDHYRENNGEDLTAEWG